jgi:hypothetical protein
VAAPWLVATAGALTADVVPVAVVTSGTVSVRLFEVALSVLEPEEPLEDAELEELVMVADPEADELAMLEELVMITELEADELAAEAELALLTDDSIEERIELAAVLVEACFDRDETNAELLDGLRLVAVNVVVATGLPAVEVVPLVLQEERAMPSAAASLQMAEEVQDILKDMT